MYLAAVVYDFFIKIIKKYSHGIEISDIAVLLNASVGSGWVIISALKL